MQQSLEQSLTQFGFDDKEAKVYLATLELGAAKAIEIARKAGIERTTSYDILTKLAQQGLIGKYSKKGISYYMAADPKKIQNQLEEKQRAFGHLLPELLGIYNSLTAKPKIQYYEGIEGIKSVLEDTLTTREKKLRSIFSITDLFKIPGKVYIEEYVKRRIQTGINLQVIRSKLKDVPQYWPGSAEERRSLRYAPSSMVFSMTTYLYDNKAVLISSKKENFGMIIESEEFHQNMSHLFDALWQISATA